MDHSGRLLHLAERSAWVEAELTGAYDRSTRGAALDQVGFVHASTAAQLPRVADFLYGDVPVEQLVLLVVDQRLLAAAGVAVRWEDLDGADELFPHLLGALPVDAVVAALPLTRDGAGHVVLPELDALDVVAAPPTASR